MPTFVLAAVIYVPLLLTHPGKVGADTKTYLYLDPARMLSRAPSMWDPGIGMGTVTHQNIGYLWPIGPWYWLMQNIGVPDWVAQRLWLGSILFVAGVGVRYLLKALGQRGPHVTAATFLYALTPYVLTLGARLSVILLPYAGLPWLIAFTVLALRRGGWRYPALFALTVTTIGSVNATALVLSGVGPLLWILSELVITRETSWRHALATVARIGAITVGCSLWWIAGLWAQGGYGIDILRYTETAQTVATGSAAPEVLRSLGYWFFYGEDTYGPWIAPSKMYTQRLWLLFLTYLLPVLALAGAAIARFRERAFFAVLVLAGAFLAVGGHPWDAPPPAGKAVKAFLLSNIGLSMRSLPRAVPLLALGMAVLLGAGIAALTAERQRLARPLTAVAVALAILALPPLWTGKMVDDNLQRPQTLPAYWRQDAAALDGRGKGTRVLELPGADFASYRWGTTVDPITPGLMNRPYVARELIPYGSPPSADLLNALDGQLQESVLAPAAIAPIARLMSVGDVNVRSDLTYERYNTPRPRLLWNLLAQAPGLGRPIGFGGTARNQPRPSLPMLDETELLTPTAYPDPPQVAIIPVQQPEAIVRTSAATRPVIVAGDGSGLVGAAAAGLLSGHELVLYSASLAAHPDQLRAQLDQLASLVLTDTNRRRGRRWGTVRETTGATERAGQQAMRFDPKDQRLDLFPDATDASSTVAVGRGGAWAEATSYGNAVSLTPEDQAAYAVDGDPRTGVQDAGTAWRVGGFDKAEGEAIRVHYTQPVTTDQVRLVQALGGVRNRFITEVRVSFDGADDVTIPLDATSRANPGQVVRFPRRTFSTMQITITRTDVGRRARYDGISPVGFAVIDVQPGSPTSPVGDDVVRLPTDLLAAAGTRSLSHPLAIVLTRLRSLATNAVRGDEERSIARTFALPTARSFNVVGQVRLASGASDDTIDRALGLPGAAAGGVTATSGRRLPGGLANRASAAIDGDPTTWYSPGFLNQRDEHVTYVLAKPLSFDHMDLTVLNDGRHSVPQRIRIEVDGRVTAAVDLPAIGDQATPGAHHTFALTLPKLTGRTISVIVDNTPHAVREVTTLDYYTHQPVAMPVGLVDLGIPGLHVPAPPARVDARCRTDLLTVDGRPVGVSLTGTTADLLAGKPIPLTLCSGQALPLGAGERTLRTALGQDTGLNIDLLTLRSAGGGTADRGTGTLTPSQVSAARPGLTVHHAGRTAYDLTVAGSPHSSWLILGQSHNLGWHATVGGQDLGPPTLVDGYANGWRLPASSGPVRVHLEWTPQRVVWGSIILSLLAVAAALVLIFWPRRQPSRADDGGRVPLDARPSMPRPFRIARVMQYAGPRPSTFATAATVLGALVVGGAVIGPIAGVALAVVTAVAMRFHRARPLLTLGSPALLALSAAFLIAKQVVNHLPSGFDWPTYFDKVHQVAWAAVALLVIDVVVDRCWLRRWWPTDDSSW
ncbi:MAG: hypothetical protein JWN46_502 [Acidimicrobiales bacterium]|nr:hypothetical protein [Acidimicrobiales bacterium]